VALEEHFARSAPHVRQTFDALLEAVERQGPVTVNATRSRITFQTQMRFGGVDPPRRDHLVARFVLTRPLESERIARVDFIAPYYYDHRVWLDRPDEVDDDTVQELIAEAYQVGERRHVTDEDWPRVRKPPGWVHVPGGWAR
jgi:hypothetical protein